MKFRPWYLWAALALITALIVIILLGIISLRPVRELLVPESFVGSEDILLLRERVLELERLAETQNLYIVNLRRLLSGEVIDHVDTTAVRVVNPDSMYTVSRIDEDETLRQTIALEDKLVALDNQAHSTRSMRAVEQLYLVPPLTGVLSLGYDPSRNHLGVDINAPANTPIKSIASGHVVFAGWTLETGNTIGILHHDQLMSFYKHNSSLLQKEGNFVQAGEAIAIIGNTGTLSSGPHLHFELWIDGKPVDPTRYINFN